MQIYSHEKHHGGLPCGWRCEASKEQLPETHSHLCWGFHAVMTFPEDAKKSLLIMKYNKSYKWRYSLITFGLDMYK